MFEPYLRVLIKFLLLRVLSQASHSVSSWLVDAHGLVLESFLRFVDASSLVVFDWAVFDHVSGCKTFVDTERFFRWIALWLLCEFSCTTSPTGPLCLVLIVLHCFTVLTSCGSWWSVCVSASRDGDLTYKVDIEGYLFAFSEINVGAKTTLI